MSVFVIADLHLPGGQDKNMDVFGDHWVRHFEKISEDWQERVSEEDTVLIPGDISWAMNLDDARADLESIGSLPGKKILIRGNHDFWWSSISRIRSMMPPNMFALQYDALDMGTFVVCGTRGWVFPGSRPEILGGEKVRADDEKIYRRELLRMQMSLDEARKKQLSGDKRKPLVVMTHYPPLDISHTRTEVTDLMESYRVHSVVYGHLHGNGIGAGFQGKLRGVRYYLTSCDSLGFRLMELPLPV
ncbi:MAG: metallophosphoesterase [Clostridia bacterium]|nr:metallophosphoesterase [Clostridia bacterium]